MFDPTKPADHSPLSSAEMRGQLNALKTFIDAIQNGAVNIYAQESDPGGVDGDLWIRPSDGELFRHEGGGWADKGSLKGPQGNPGDKGDTGDKGDKGDQGDQGPVGEVSAVQLSDGLAATLAAAAANSSANTNAVPTLDTPFANDPPTLADMEVMRAAYNTLVQAQRR